MNLIRERAWSFYKTTGLPYEDLYSEACLGYCNALNSYEKGQCKFTTYAFRYMTNALIDYCRNEKQQILNSALDIDQLLMLEQFHPQVMPEEGKELDYKKASETVQLILDIVMQDDVLFGQMPPKKVRGKIVRVLRIYGWKWDDIWAAMKETKQFVLNEI